MDNITHTIIGLGMGQAATRLYARKQPSAASRLQTPLWVTSALANNLPDLDVLYAGWLSGKLGYVLHHRGWTHTLLLAPLQSLFLLFLARLWASRGGAQAPRSRSDWFWIVAVAFAGPFAHIGFDYLNSYGVHPFWPFDSRWFYGDSVFIIEPLLWITLLPALLVESSSSMARLFLGGLLALGLGACVFTGYVPWQITLTAIAATAWLLGLMVKLKPGPRIAAAGLCCAFLAGAFVSLSQGVRQAARNLVATELPKSQLLDLAISPFPANPLCWSLVTVEREGENYVSRRGIFAAAPHLFGAAECPDLHPAGGNLTFALTPVPAPSRPDLLWSGQFEKPLAELKRLARNSCSVRAMLRFVRVPGWRIDPDGSFVFGDLRFDRGGKRGFSKFAAAAASEECPGQIPGWTPPRALLLERL